MNKDTTSKPHFDWTNATKSFFSNLFTSSNLILTLIFLAIYFVLYFGLGVYFRKENNPTGNQMVLSRSIDILIVVTAIIFLIYWYKSISSENKDHIVKYLFDWSKDWFEDSKTIIELGFFLFMFYIFIYIGRVPMTRDTKPNAISFIEGKLWSLFVLILILDFFKYVLGIDIIAFIFNDDIIGSLDEWINKVTNIKDSSASPDEIGPTMNNYPTKRTDASWNVYDASWNVYDASSNVYDVSSNRITKPPKPTTQPYKEVFNVSNNLYTYDDAQAICSVYDSTLATYDQVEDAYNNGGEWCNYGWSEGQMILFPTQKATWDKLQKTDKNKNDCGRPGVNGGVIENPYMKFGVNCYGIKPKPKDGDLERMNANQNKTYPKTVEEKVLDAKLQYWKKHANELLKLNSYNYKTWSEY
jgi:hypothetical protein